MVPADWGSGAVGFREIFGEDPQYFSRTPGRVNLIGEHTDYNGGWVFPFALENASIGMWAGSARDGRTTIVALDLGERIDFDAENLPAPRPGHWGNYLVGVMAEFAALGLAIPQVRICFGGNIPRGGGLSSSAALSNCIGLILNAMIRAGLSRESLAILSQASEHRYAGVRCGIMDQYATLLARRGQGLLLDCRNREYRYIPVHVEPYVFMLLNSMVKHELAESGYNERRAECESALGKLRGRFPEMRDLRDCTAADLAASSGMLTEAEHRRVLHQIGENARVLSAVSALEAGDLPRLGRMMAESHHSLSRIYEVSSPEQDFLVESAMRETGVCGARMTGGGFGGNVICLVAVSSKERFAERMVSRFRGRFGKIPDIRECRPGDGASLQERSIPRTSIQAG